MGELAASGERAAAPPRLLLFTGHCRWGGPPQNEPQPRPEPEPESCPIPTRSATARARVWRGAVGRLHGVHA